MLKWLKRKFKRKKEIEILDNDSVMIPSVREIAEQLGLFPSDVEDAIKVLQEQGKVKCYWAEGELYPVFSGDLTIDDLQKTVKPSSKNDCMYG